MKTYEKVSDKLSYYEMYCNENSKSGKAYETKIVGLEHRIKRQLDKIKKLESTCRVTEEQVFEKENLIVKKDMAYQRLYKETALKINELSESIKKYQKAFNINGNSKSKKSISELDANISFSHNVTRKGHTKTPIDTKKTILPPLGKGKTGLGPIEIRKSSTRFRSKLVAYNPKSILGIARLSIDSNEAQNKNDVTQPIILNSTADPIETLKQEEEKKAIDNFDIPANEIVSADKPIEAVNIPLANSEAREEIVVNNPIKSEEKKEEKPKENQTELLESNDDTKNISNTNPAEVEIKTNQEAVSQNEAVPTNKLNEKPPESEQKADGEQVKSNDISENVMQLQQ